MNIEKFECVTFKESFAWLVRFPHFLNQRLEGLPKDYNYRTWVLFLPPYTPLYTWAAAVVWLVVESFCVCMRLSSFCLPFWPFSGPLEYKKREKFSRSFFIAVESSAESVLLFDCWLPNYKAKQFGALLFLSLVWKRRRSWGRLLKRAQKKPKRFIYIISTSPPPPHLGSLIRHLFLLNTFAVDWASQDKIRHSKVYFFSFLKAFPPTFWLSSRLLVMVHG